MLSKSSKYALKAVLFLAINSNEEKKVMVKNIAKPINVPQAYIAKLLQSLSKQNIISSAKGPNGGFYLNDINKKQSVLDIIYAIDGEHRLNSCLLSLENCNAENPCPLHELANSSRSGLIHSFKNQTIKDLSLEIISGKSVLPL